MKKTLLIIFFLVLSFNAYAQTYDLRGKIIDSGTNTPLEFVTVKLANSASGTTSDAEGNYIIKLPNGLHNLIFSYIGYNSDTITVNVNGADETRDVYLSPSSSITTDEIVVTGEDPAYEIIRRAIRYKKQFQSRLTEYEYDAYSKFIIRSSQGSVEPLKSYLDTITEDKLGILGILESETKGYFKKPDLIKEIVKAKRETANITRGLALPLIVNFYDEDIDLRDVKIPGPVADDAFDNYDYKLLGTTYMDSLPIFKIQVTNLSNLVPQFYGTVYISDSIFALMKVDLYTNDAAKLRAIDKINFQQKFTNFYDKNNGTFWMPTDVQIFADGSFAGLVQFNAEVYSIISSYELNKKAPPGTFDDYIIKVMPDAKKDSSYWAKNQLLKNSTEEDVAYDKIEEETARKKRSISLGLTTINFGQHFSLSPISLYRFNRVEGSHLQLNLNYRTELGKDVASGYFGYGFSDKKTKYSLSYTKRLLKDRSLVISGSIFRDLEPLNYNAFGLAQFYNTGKALLDKKDEYDYFYASGYSFRVTNSTIPQVRVSLRYLQEKQTTANTNTDFSFRKKDEPFKINPPINDAFMRSMDLSLRLDANQYKYIDWGDGEDSRIRLTNYPSVEFYYQHSPKAFGSTYEFRTLSAELSGRNNLSPFLNLRYRLSGSLMTGEVPFQNLLNFASRTGGLDQPMSFRTMEYQEYLGDKQFYLNLENNLGKILWGNVPFIKKFDLILFYNAGRMDLKQENFDRSVYKGFSGTEGIFHEAGFGIGGILDVFRVDLAWRLNNYREGRNFNIMISLDNF